jgi:nicotinamidase/pyrazinamidase
LAPAGPSLLRIGHPKRPYDIVTLPYGPQILWPDQCVRATSGAEFHADLHIPHAALVLRKGIHREIDSYSTFYENDRTTPTGLVGYLRERGFTRVFLAGLAFDFCVRYSAEDAQWEKFEVVVGMPAGIDVDNLWPPRNFATLGIVRSTAGRWLMVH